MDKLFFYGSIILVLAIFFIAFGRRQFQLRHLFLMISYSLYNLIFELIFGEVLDLYYYINKTHSLIYTIIAAVFLYPVIAVLYVLFLPKGKKIIWYTSGCIILILVLEIISLYTGTVVLTAWRVIPWSIITYIVSFSLIYLLNGYLQKVLPDS